MSGNHLLRESVPQALRNHERSSRLSISFALSALFLGDKITILLDRLMKLSRKPTPGLNKPLARMLRPTEVALSLPRSREPMPEPALLGLILQVRQGGSF